MDEFRVKQSLLLGITLFGIWLLWSGHYTPLLLFFGIASCLSVVLLSRRMDLVDHDEQLLLLAPRLLLYVPWLAKEIVLANLDVAWRILHPKMPIDPVMIKVKASQRTDIARVIYANSITLTPGTVSVQLDGDEITVHSLTREAATGEATGKMDRKVTRTIEGGS